MTDLIPQSIRNFIDAIFNAPLSFLNMIIDVLNQVSLVAGKGISLNHYFGFFAYMPSELQMVVQSLLVSIVFLGLIYVIKSIWNVYLNVKQSLKWW